MKLHRILPVGMAAAALALPVLSPAAVSAAAGQHAPVIHEKFTVLACPKKPSTTLALEGCAEHRVLAADRAIDALNAKVFAKLGRSGRATFTRAHASWLAYRDAACTAQASIYSGGSVQPVVYASCLASVDGSHVGELRKMLAALSPAG